jgi:hypothetical protein
VSEYEVKLAKPDGGASVENVSLEETALGMQERWEAKGDGYKAEVRISGEIDAYALLAA